MYLIFKKAINNILKHSNATKVSINLRNESKYFSMSIKDNGSVKTKSQKKTGQGLKNMQMRAKKINGNLEIRKRAGYKIKLTLKEI